MSDTSFAISDQSRSSSSSLEPLEINNQIDGQINKYDKAQQIKAKKPIIFLNGQAFMQKMNTDNGPQIHHLSADPSMRK